MSKTKPKVSLCMIVRNEEAVLPRCLASASPFVDEVIVVDTGSTDKTVTIAKQWGCVVKDFSWSGDFSAARNYSLEQAKGDWIIYLDADEELCVSQVQHLNQLTQLDHTGVEGLLLPLDNRMETFHGDYQRFMVLRLFKNSPSYRFHGSIHEQVGVADSAKIGLITEGLSIIHHGYCKENRKDKNQRNQTSLKIALSRDPGNPYLEYYLGVEKVYGGQLKEGLRLFERAYQKIPPGVVTLRTALLINLISCLIQLGHFHRAKIIIQQEKVNYPDYPELPFLLGLLDYEEGELSSAESNFLKAVQMGRGNPLYTSLAGVTTYKSYYWLGYCREQQNKGEEALQWYIRAVRDKPQFTLAIYGLIGLLMNTNNPDQVISYLACRQLESPPVLEGLAYLFGYAGFYEQAREYLRSKGTARAYLELGRGLRERGLAISSQAPCPPGIEGPLGGTGR